MPKAPKDKEIAETQLDLFSDPETITAAQVMDAMDADLIDDERWPSTLVQLVDVVFDMLEERWQEKLSGYEMELARDVAIVISHYLGGRSIYLPKDEKLTLALRDIAIYRAFDGSNHLDLATKTGLTTAQIYNIIAKQRQLRYDKTQKTLPFPG